MDGRQKLEAWDCSVGDSIADPCYFNPPVSPTGRPVLEALALHKAYPAGRLFVRSKLGDLWKRIN